MKHRKQLRKSSIKRARRRQAPRTAEDFFASPEEFQTDYENALRVISKMRTDGLSLKKAAQKEGVNPRTVTRLGGRALRKRSNRSYAVSQRDTLLRVINVITAKGKREVTIRDSRKATTIAKHSSAVHKYLQTGDASDLKTFRRRHITDAHGNRIELLTDLTTLDRLGFANELSFESLYARVA